MEITDGNVRLMVVFARYTYWKGGLKPPVYLE